MTVLACCRPAAASARNTRPQPAGRRRSSTASACSAMRRWPACIAVAHGGEASTSTNGFWASLNIATTERLPLLYFIEDNGYGISVPATKQTPGGDIAANLAAFRNLRILAGEGSDPVAAAALIDDGGDCGSRRRRAGPAAAARAATVRPFGPGHAGLQECRRDRIRTRTRPAAGAAPAAGAGASCPPSDWRALEAEAETVVQPALARIEARPPVSTVNRRAPRIHRAERRRQPRAAGPGRATGRGRQAAGGQRRRRDRKAPASTC